MRKKWYLILVLGLLGAGTALQGGYVSAQQDAVVVSMGPGRNGSQTGAAILTGRGDQTEVVMDIQPGPSGIQQPAFIHEAPCPNVGAVRFPLNSVINGKSTTLLSIQLRELLNGQYAINVHQGPGVDINLYISCGVVPAIRGASSRLPGSPSSLPRSGGPDPTTLVLVAAASGIALLTLGRLLGRSSP